MRGLLGRAGFTDVELDGLTAPMVWGRDAEDAHGFVLGLLGWMLDGRHPEDREHAVEALRAALREHEGPDGVALASATWVVTARRAHRDGQQDVARSPV